MRVSFVRFVLFSLVTYPPPNPNYRLRVPLGHACPEDAPTKKLISSVYTRVIELFSSVYTRVIELISSVYTRVIESLSSVYTRVIELLPQFILV